MGDFLSPFGAQCLSLPGPSLEVSGLFNEPGGLAGVLLTFSEPMNQAVLPGNDDFDLMSVTLQHQTELDAKAWTDATHLQITFTDAISGGAPYLLDYAALGARLQTAEAEEVDDFTDLLLS